MAYERDWFEDEPTDDTYAHEIDDYMQRTRVDVAERLKDMVYGFTAGETDEGFKEAWLLAQTAPSALANAIKLYGKDVSAKCMLHAKDEDGHERQLTKQSGSNLLLNIVANEDLTLAILKDTILNNNYVQGKNAAGDGYINIIKVNGSNELELGAVAQLPNTSKLASSGAPTADAQIANKKYVDDQCDAHVGIAGQYHADGTTVFNATMTAGSTFQDLDLSSYVGSNSALCYFEVTTNAGPLQVSVKPKGNGGDGSKHLTGYHSAGNTSIVSNCYQYLVSGTNSSGVVQIAANNNTSTVTIKLIGYIK